MPLFPPQPPAPWFLGHRELITAQTAGASTRTANGAYLHDVDVATSVVVTGFTIDHGGVSAGHLDLGIYDSNGNLVTHTGIVAAGAINTPQSIALGTPVALAPGRYSFAAWVDNALDTYYARTGMDNSVWGNFRTSVNLQAGGLLATLTALGGTNPAGIFFPFIANLQGTGF